jgi:hypothetical protein
MIWNNENNQIMYVGQRITPQVFPNLVSRTIIPSPLVDVVGLTCGVTDSRLYFIQGKDMNVRELTQAKYHKNSKHITVETTFQIYTTDKKTLFDYYKKQFHKGIQYLEACINTEEQKANTALNNNTNTIMNVHYALKNIQEYRELKVNAMNTYRQIIETIKKL